MITKDSPEWPGMKAWLGLQIQQVTARLVSADCGIKEADLLRGEIIGYRAILAFVEPAMVIPLREVVAPPGTNY